MSKKKIKKNDKTHVIYYLKTILNVKKFTIKNVDRIYFIIIDDNNLPIDFRTIVLPIELVNKLNTDNNITFTTYSIKHKNKYMNPFVYDFIECINCMQNEIVNQEVIFQNEM